MKFLYLLLLLFLFASCSKIPTVERDEVLVVVPYPNPVGEVLAIHVENDEMTAYLIRIFNPKADHIFEENVQAGDPKHSFQIDLRGKPKGRYQIILTKNSFTYSKNFVKI